MASITPIDQESYFTASWLGNLGGVITFAVLAILAISTAPPSSSLLGAKVFVGLSALCLLAATYGLLSSKKHPFTTLITAALALGLLNLSLAYFYQHSALLMPLFAMLGITHLLVHIPGFFAIAHRELKSH